RSVDVVAGQIAVVIPGTVAPFVVQSVFFNGIFQNPTAYTLAGNTLTFTEALPEAGTVTVHLILVVPTEPALAGNLASATAGMGAELVGFLQGGAGAVARTLKGKSAERVSVLDFIPVSQHAAIRAFTSTYDATAAITAAYAYAKTIRTTLFVPAGLYLVSFTITLDGHGFVGEGTSGANLDLETITTHAVTLFRWTGIAGGTVFNQSGRLGGIDIGNFAVDCADTADIGLQFDRLTFSRILPLKVVSWRADQVGKGGIVIKPNPAFVNDNFMFNQIGPLYLRGPTCCLRLTTFNGASANGCHNTFNLTMVDCRGGTSNQAIVIDDADNNTFLMTYTAVFNYPTDYGLSLESAAARANYFWHFQGGINAKAGSKNAVFGFDRENGQPQPTVAATAELFWTETGNNAQMWNLTQAMRSLQVRVDGTLSLDGAGPDPSRFSMRRAATNTFTSFGYDAGGVLRINHTADGNAFGVTPIRIGNGQLGFFGATQISKPAVTGSRGGNAALASFLTQMATLGLITDSTTA
ncbi:MAG TPA: hypothetical protein VNM48_23535, partial [Chloroflexota bacterium]|nr:hypothetical protein [Chloroflexota bacterium]